MSVSRTKKFMLISQGSGAWGYPWGPVVLRGRGSPAALGGAAALRLRTPPAPPPAGLCSAGSRLCLGLWPGGRLPSFSLLAQNQADRTGLSLLPDDLESVQGPVCGCVNGLSPGLPPATWSDRLSPQHWSRLHTSVLLMGGAAKRRRHGAR